MMELLKSFVLQLVGAAMLSAAALALTPEGRVKKVVQIVCGFVVMAAFLSIAMDFDYRSLSQNMAQYRSEGEAFSKNLEEENDRLLRLIIEEETSAYILDKGGDIGIGHLEVSVSAKWSDDGYWYPSGVEIASNASESQKKELMRCIEAELGIPEEMQTWSTEDESK